MNQIKLYGKPIRVNKATSDKKNLDVGADPGVGEKCCTIRSAVLVLSYRLPRLHEIPILVMVKDAAIDANHAMNGQYLINTQTTTQPSPGKVRVGTKIWRFFGIFFSFSGFLLYDVDQRLGIEIDRFALPDFNFLKLSGSWMIGLIVGLGLRIARRFLTFIDADHVIVIL
ncbi:unnamed protein product [Rhizophagus irregularis]|nr:unnamed protein product [Rhizophagus irregularis]